VEDLSGTEILVAVGGGWTMSSSRSSSSVRIFRVVVVTYRGKKEDREKKVSY
jgi:hypothetical protein